MTGRESLAYSPLCNRTIFILLLPSLRSHSLIIHSPLVSSHPSCPILSALPLHAPPPPPIPSSFSPLLLTSPPPVPPPLLSLPPSCPSLLPSQIDSTGANCPEFINAMKFSSIWRMITGERGNLFKEMQMYKRYVQYTLYTH